MPPYNHLTIRISPASTEYVFLNPDMEGDLEHDKDHGCGAG